ncbi:hypothetical protein FJY69_10250 [candidate division WOR-3 bacterium]|nr:hypothetical protein [candidate division WOR-3 bacterium]
MLPTYPRERLVAFGLRVNRLYRRLPCDRVLEAVAEDAVKRVGPDTGPDRLAGAARIALELAGRVTPETDEQWICRRIDEIRQGNKPEGGNVSEVENPSVTEEQPPSVEDKLQAARAREEKVVVKVKLADLRKKVAGYLGQRLENPEAAELIAQELVDAFEQKSVRAKPRPELQASAAEAAGIEGAASWPARPNRSSSPHTPMRRPSLSTRTSGSAPRRS